MRITFSTPLARMVLAGMLVAGGLSARPLAPGASAQSPRADETGENREFLASVSTSFGIYQPYAVPQYRVSVGRGEPAVATNFSNIAVADETFPWSSYFSAGERALLVQNGFVARPEATASFGQAYSPETSSHDVGSFITVDALLHGLRVTLDEATRDMERNYAAPALSNHLASLSTAITRQLEAERNGSLTEALDRLLGYVQTAQALVNPSAPISPRVQEDVAAELRKIKGAAGEAPSSVLPQQTIDYALFAPQGYYKLDNQLSSYYRAKVWLSRVGFNLRKPNGAPDLAGVRTAAMLARMIDGLDDDGYFKQTLRNINEPGAFLTGGAESIAPWDILTNAMRGYYGRIVAAGPGFLADDQMLAGFVGYVSEQLPESAGRDQSMPAFRLIEWNAAPAHDVFDQVWSEQGTSLGSYGMTLMAAMGSVRASELLGARSGYARGGSAQLGSRQVAAWVQDIDRTILYTVQPLVAAAARDESYPRFMRSDAWRSRELNSALGGWADYLHTPATMMMQSVVKAGGVTSPGGDLATAGYVEPNPEAWARVASLAGYIRNGLTEGRGERLIGRKVEAKLQDIERAAAKLMQIAAIELDGKDLTADQLELIQTMPRRIAAYESFADKSLQGEGFVVSAGAASMARGGSVANGHPLMVYVIVPRNDGGDGLMLTRGAIYSYYEVSASDNDWRRQISTPGSSVSTDARLMGSFASTDRGFAQDGSKFLGISASLPSSPVGYTPTKAERFAEMSRAQLSLEQSVVSRGTTDELWFTVHAPNLEGTRLAVSVANIGGQQLSRAEIGSIKNGERLDVIRVKNLSNGKYFLRVEDLTGKVLATGRFTVTR
jgi:Protein of unknown function (DUF3160)